MSAPVRCKICCIASVAEAKLAVAHGAAAIGLVSAMPSGPGPIADALIAEIVPTVPPGVATFLLTCGMTPADVAAQQRHTGASVIQLVDHVDAAFRRELRALMPNGVKIVQVVHVVDEGSVEFARSAAEESDALLLDSGNPALAVKELGGTGRVHDWALSRRIRDGVPCPVWLAGGLRPENVAAAIDLVRPFGVDLCSGVRTGGALDPAKLAAFTAAVRQASLDA